MPKKKAAEKVEPLTFVIHAKVFEHRECGNCGALFVGVEALFNVFGDPRCPYCCSSDVRPTEEMRED